MKNIQIQKRVMIQKMIQAINFRGDLIHARKRLHIRQQHTPQTVNVISVLRAKENALARLHNPSTSSVAVTRVSSGQSRTVINDPPYLVSH